MKIVVLTGSPHKNGTSALLAERFIQGATESGHQIYRFDAAFQRVNPCVACNHCKQDEKECIYRDSMLDLRQRLLDADLVAFVTPLFYHDATSQLKAVIDRFYAFDADLRSRSRMAALLITAAEHDEAVALPIKLHYHTTISYLNWTDRGMVLALGCSSRDEIEASPYPEIAYRLGQSL